MWLKIRQNLKTANLTPKFNDSLVFTKNFQDLKKKSVFCENEKK